MKHIYKDTPKKRPVNLTVREDVLYEAKKLNLNTSKAAEAGIINAIKKTQEAQWLEENRDAINAHNARVEKSGVSIKAYWMEEDYNGSL